MERGQNTRPQRTQQPRRSAPPRRAPQRPPQRRPGNRRPSARRFGLSKGALIIASVIAIVAIIVIIIAIVNARETAESVERIKANAATVRPLSEIVDNATPAPNSTEKVDQIIALARADAGTSNAALRAETAYIWIVTNVPQWYDGNEIMEQAIYNGALVEYYYKGKNDIRAEVGMNTVQSVKYVYRGVETVLDEATRENIRQIRDGIANDQG